MASSDEKKAPALDFNALVLSLGSSVIVHLGEAPDPTTGQKREQLEAGLASDAALERDGRICSTCANDWKTQACALGEPVRPGRVSRRPGGELSSGGVKSTADQSACVPGKPTFDRRGQYSRVKVRPARPTVRIDHDCEATGVNGSNGHPGREWPWSFERAQRGIETKTSCHTGNIRAGRETGLVRRLSIGAVRLRLLVPEEIDAQLQLEAAVRAPGAQSASLIHIHWDPFEEKARRLRDDGVAIELAGQQTPIQREQPGLRRRAGIPP